MLDGSSFQRSSSRFAGDLLILFSLDPLPFGHEDWALYFGGVKIWQLEKSKRLRSTSVPQRQCFSRAQSRKVVSQLIGIKSNKPTLNHNNTENRITIREYPVSTRKHKAEVYRITIVNRLVNTHVILGRTLSGRLALRAVVLKGRENLLCFEISNI